MDKPCLGAQSDQFPKETEQALDASLVELARSPLKNFNGSLLLNRNPLQLCDKPMYVADCQRGPAANSPVQGGQMRVSRQLRDRSFGLQYPNPAEQVNAVRLRVSVNVDVPPVRPRSWSPSRIRELAERIRETEAAGVLRWIIDGATQWQAMGLSPPKVVLDQTAAYKAAEDAIGRFIEECCVRVKEAQVKAGHLYTGYKEWCQSQGEHAVRGNDFFAEIVARGFEKKVTATGKIYRGLGLQAVDQEGDDAQRDSDAPAAKSTVPSWMPWKDETQ